MKKILIIGVVVLLLISTCFALPQKYQVSDSSETANGDYYGFISTRDDWWCIMKSSAVVTGTKTVETFRYAFGVEDTYSVGYSTKTFLTYYLYNESVQAGNTY